MLQILKSLKNLAEIFKSSSDETHPINRAHNALSTLFSSKSPLNQVNKLTKNLKKLASPVIQFFKNLKKKKNTKQSDKKASADVRKISTLERSQKGRMARPRFKRKRHLQKSLKYPSMPFRIETSSTTPLTAALRLSHASSAMFIGGRVENGNTSKQFEASLAWKDIADTYNLELSGNPAGDFLSRHASSLLSGLDFNQVNNPRPQRFMEMIQYIEHNPEKRAQGNFISSADMRPQAMLQVLNTVLDNAKENGTYEEVVRSMTDALKKQTKLVQSQGENRGLMPTKESVSNMTNAFYILSLMLGDGIKKSEQIVKHQRNMLRQFHAQKDSERAQPSTPAVYPTRMRQ